MATRLNTSPSLGQGQGNAVAENYTLIKVIQWTGILNGDQGDYAMIPGGWELEYVQAFGTAGAGFSLTWDSTLEPAAAPTNPVSPTLYTGAVLPAITALPHMLAIAETPLQIRPRVTAGDGTTNITCIALLRKSV